MAFNPFHGFRKHRKVYFAALTILCMLTFVLAGSSGLFQELLSVFTGGRSQGVQVATMYGKSISATEIQNLRIQRDTANRYMINAVVVAAGTAHQQALQGIQKSTLDQTTKNELQQILNDQLGQQFQANSFKLQDLHARFEREKKPNEAKIVKDVVDAVTLHIEALPYQL